MSIIKEHENLMNLKRDEMNIHTGDIFNLTKPIKKEEGHVIEWGMGKFEVIEIYFDFFYWESDTLHLRDLETGDKWCSDYESIKNGVVSLPLFIMEITGKQLSESLEKRRCNQDKFGFTQELY